MTDIFSYIYWAAAIVYFLFILFCRMGWRMIPKQHSIAYNPTTSVSVILPARNEEKNILNCLEDLAEQNYPSALFEVIVVDDDSTDDTVELANEFIQINNDKSFRLIQLKESNQTTAFKKFAITKGIQAARGQLILTTDADCRLSSKWISSVVQQYEITKASMIAGPVCFEKENTFLEKIQSLEFMGLVGIGAGAMQNHLHLMCNGANLAYTKNIFHEVNGFDAAETVATGDDTQLMQKIAAGKKGKITFLKSKDAIIYTAAKNSLPDLFQQRKRWASKIPRHTSVATLVIAVSAYLLHLCIVLAAAIMIAGNQFSLLLLLPFAGKCFIEFIFLFDLSRFFARQRLLWLLLPAQIIYPFYIIVIGAVAPFGRYQWKTRKVK